MRVDAARNQARILQAARALVAEQGESVSMETVAARAGVAVGTLYRHHPTKAALLRAVVDESAERVADDVAAARTRVDAGGDAGAELFRLLRDLADRLVVDQTVKAALGERAPADIEAHPEGSAVRRGAAGLAGLLAAAQRQGTVRPDVTPGDLVLLVAGLPGPEVPGGQRARVVDVVLTGLRAAR